MAIPETYELVLPLLKVIKDKDHYKVVEILDEVIEVIDISDEDMELKLPNNEPVISSRISTANTYLKKAELIESPKFGYFKISEDGLKLLEDDPDEITEDDLMEYSGFKEFKNVYNRGPGKEDKESENPSESLRSSFEKQMEDLKKELETEVLRENNKKYFQPKQENANNEIYEIRSHKETKSPKAPIAVAKPSNQRGKIDEDRIGKSRADNEIQRTHRPQRHHNHHRMHHKKHVVYKNFSPADELLKYAELFERGYLTKEEFEAKKAELLKLEY